MGFHHHYAHRYGSYERPAFLAFCSLLQPTPTPPLTMCPCTRSCSHPRRASHIRTPVLLTASPLVSYVTVRYSSHRSESLLDPICLPVMYNSSAAPRLRYVDDFGPYRLCVVGRCTVEMQVMEGKKGMSRSAEAFFTLSHRFVFIYASADRALRRPAMSHNSNLTIGRVARRRHGRVVVKLQVFQKPLRPGAGAGTT